MKKLHTIITGIVVSAMLALHCACADDDFSTQKFPIKLPTLDGKVSTWAMYGHLFTSKLLWRGAEEDGREFTAKEEKMKREAEAAAAASGVIIGYVMVPKTLVAENSERELGSYTIRRLALSYAFEPEVGKVTDLMPKLKAFRVSFSIKTGDANRIQIRDILPSTAFVDGSLSGQITATSRVGLNKGGHFVIADGNAAVGAEATFSWVYKPKDLAVASGVVGNEAFIDFQPRKNGEFYVGQVPIELSLLVPKDVNVAEITLGTSLVSDKDTIVPAGVGIIKVLFP